jgi:hypothetical protein
VPHPGHAVYALLKTAGRYPGEIELVTLGPRTNVAMALNTDPSFAGKVKALFLLGICPPRSSPSSASLLKIPLPRTPVNKGIMKRPRLLFPHTA